MLNFGLLKKGYNMSNDSNGSGSAVDQANRSSGTVTETDSASAKLKQTAEKPDSMKPRRVMMSPNALNV